MKPQLIDLTILNTLLGLPQDNQLESTLFSINELLIFKKNYQNYKSIITRLEQQITRFKIKINKDITNHLHQKIEILRQEVNYSETMVAKKSMQEASKEKSYLNIESLEEFLQKEFSISYKEVVMKREKMKVRNIEGMRIVVSPLCSLDVRK